MTDTTPGQNEAQNRAVRGNVYPYPIALARRYVPALRAWGFDPRLGCAFGWAESEWDPDAMGDYDDTGFPTSFGFLQVNLIHGYGVERLSGIDGALFGFEKVCAPRWRDTLAWAKYRDAAAWWNRDPVGFFMAFGPDAQGAVPSHYAARAAESVAAADWIYRDYISREEGLFYTADGRPIPVPGSYGRPFGVRDEWAPDGHRGYDFPCNLGDPVRAVADGVVTWSAPRDRDGKPRLDPTSGTGYTVITMSADGIERRYGHNSALLVYVGQQVMKGETIALAGSTGYSTGVHLHLERIEGGTLTDPTIDLTVIQPPTLPPVYMTARVAPGTGGLNVRAAPSTTAPILGTLPDDAEIPLVVALRLPVEAWLPCLYKNQLAYVYAAWLWGEPLSGEDCAAILSRYRENVATAVQGPLTTIGTAVPDVLRVIRETEP